MIAVYVKSNRQSKREDRCVKDCQPCEDSISELTVTGMIEEAIELKDPENNALVIGPNLRDN